MRDRARVEFRKGVVAALCCAAAAGAYLVYPVLNHGPHRIFLETGVDRAMPLVPAMVVPYVSLVPLVLVVAVVFGVADLRRLQAYALALTIALLVSYAVYATAQSYVARPTVTGSGVLKDWMRYVYGLDKPYNDFPSLHTSMSAIIAVSWMRVWRRSGWVAAGWCALIIASTVLIHQHYVADVAAGLVVAAVAVVGADWLVARLGYLTTDRRPGAQ
jgi:membrane-associated phospholipid phosphatase